MQVSSLVSAESGQATATTATTAGQFSSFKPFACDGHSRPRVEWRASPLSGNESLDKVWETAEIEVAVQVLLMFPLSMGHYS